MFNGQDKDQKIMEFTDEFRLFNQQREHFKEEINQKS